MIRPHDWEEAFNDVIDEKKEVLDALDNIVSLWEMEASMSEIENQMRKARELITKHTGVAE
jgi:hypothetical protein